MVIELGRDVSESMEVLSLFLWLEQRTHRSVVQEILKLDRDDVDKIADEAVRCLRYCISGEIDSIAASSSRTHEFILMSNLLNRDNVLDLFRGNRLTACRDMSKIIETVCLRALSDIRNEAIRQRNASSRKYNSSLGRSKPPSHPPSAPQPRSLRWPDDRTLFMTFSKGYPVHESEVKEFLTRKYGNCVESVNMQEVPLNEQSLHAHIVLRTATSLKHMLGDPPGRLKFTINGKDARLRKFELEQRKS